MTTSGACQAGACSACQCSNTTCDHGCHVDGAARTTEPVPPPKLVIDNPAFLVAVELRAVRLCTEAEPHDSGREHNLPPCVLHVSEARRQLMDQWLGEAGAA